MSASTTMGWLDVAAEPVIVSVPDHDDGRYWLLHNMDMGHFITSLFGKRTRGTKGGRFMFAGQSWQGDGNRRGGREKALSYVDDWNIRTLSEFLGQAGPKPKQAQLCSRRGQFVAGAREFCAGGWHHGHGIRPLAARVGGLRHRRG
jgi:hypothetical protein